ncbi:MAG: CcmD family protein [Bacteroidia bacterium]
MRLIRNFALFLLLFCSSLVYAQASGSGDVEMADRLKADGKIYVVIAVVLIILAGLLIYLTMIDRKVAKMEKNMEAEKQEKKQ